MYKRVMSSTITKTSTKQNKEQQQQHDEDEEMKTVASAAASTTTTNNATTNSIFDIEELHQRACHNQEKYYIDPTTGLTCFTSYFHLQRGYCCGNRCRHCPYQHINATIKKKTKNEDDDDDSSSSSSDDGSDHPINDMESMHLNDCVGLLPSSTSTSSSNNNKNKTTDPNHVETRTRTTTTTTTTGGTNGGIYTKKNVVYTRGGDMGTSQLYTGERRYKNDIVFEALGTIDELCSIVGVCYAEINHHVSLTRPVVQQQQQQQQQHQHQHQSLQSPQTQPTTSLLPSNDSNTDDTNVIPSLTTTTTTSPTISIQQDMEQVQEWLLEIMSRLFDIGSHVAKPSSLKKKTDTDDTTTTTTSHTNTTQTLDMTIHIQQLELWIDIMTEALPELTSFVLPTGSVPSAQLHLARTVCRRTERTMVPLVIAMDHHHIVNNSSSSGSGGGGDCDPTTLAYINRLSDFFFTAARYVNDRFNVPDIAYQRPSATAAATNAVTSTKGQHHHNEQRTRVVLNKSTPESK